MATVNLKRRCDVYIDDGATMASNSSSRAVVPPVVEQPFMFLDTFTGIMVPLGAHTSDSNHTWQELNTLFAPSDGNALSQNYLTGQGLLGCHDNDYYPVAPSVLLTVSDASQEIEIDFKYTTNAGPYMGFLGTSGGPTYVMNWFVSEGDDVWIDVYVKGPTGGPVDVGSLDFPYKENFLHTMKIVIKGDKKTIFVDGVQKLQFTDRRATVGAPWIALNDCVGYNEDDTTYPIFMVSRVQVITPEVEVEPPPVGGASFSDTFTGIDGTLLRNHVTDSGGAWIRDAYTQGDGFDSQLTGGMSVLSGAADYTEHYAAVEPGQNYTIKLNVVMPTISTLPGTRGRTDCFIYLVGGPSYDNWDPVAVSLGVVHSMDTVAEALVFFEVERGDVFYWESGYLGARFGQPMALELKVAGVTIELKLDGVVLKTQTLAFPPSVAHWVGMYQTGVVSTPAQWIKVDKLEVVVG